LEILNFGASDSEGKDFSVPVCCRRGAALATAQSELNNILSSSISLTILALSEHIPLYETSFYSEACFRDA
jgi:hypothetical protein